MLNRLSDEQIKLLADKMGIADESHLEKLDNERTIIGICLDIICDEYKKSVECDESAYRFYTAERIIELISFRSW